MTYNRDKTNSKNENKSINIIDLHMPYKIIVYI